MLKLLFILSCVFLLLSSCKKDSSGNIVAESPDEQAFIDDPEGYLDDATNPPSEECTECNEHIGEVKGIITGVVKSTIDKSKIQGAEVNLDGQQFVTFSAGTFVFNSLVIGSPVLIVFSHPNFITSSAEVMIKYGTVNFYEKFLTPVGLKKIFQEGDLITLNDKGALVKIYDLMTEDGELSSGDVSAAMTYLGLTTKKDVDAFPGNFEGYDSSGEPVPFIGSGMISVDLYNKEGANLKLSQDAEVTFPASDNIDADQNSVPTWFFDKKHGKWVEDGVAYRQDNGSYKAYLSKSGNWCLGQPMYEEMAKSKNRIVMETDDGPAARKNYIRIYARGKGWRSKKTYTNSNGEFELPIYPHSKYSLRATATFEKYTDDGKVFTGKYTAETVKDLRALEPGEIDDDRY